MDINAKADLNTAEDFLDCGGEIYAAAEGLVSALQKAKRDVMKMERYHHIDNITERHAQRNEDLHELHRMLEAAHKTGRFGATIKTKGEGQ